MAAGVSLPLAPSSSSPSAAALTPAVHSFQLSQASGAATRVPAGRERETDSSVSRISLLRRDIMSPAALADLVDI